MLSAARAAFAERGFDGATIRAIASLAGVDPALVHHYFGTKQNAGLALLRSAVASEDTAGLLREFLVSRVLGRVVARLDCPAQERAARGALVAAQLVGLVVARYVLHLEPLASASAEAVVAAVGPTVQRYLTGEIELPQRCG